MDLSWCIICDHKVDDVLNETSLYCSESCRIKDRMSSITHQLSINYQQNQKKSTLKFTNTLLRTKRTNTSTSSATYPWVPLYRRRRSVIMSKRCQPAVPSTPTHIKTPQSIVK